jgi:hypothetical protein
MSIKADLKQVKRTPMQEQRDRLVAALRGVQHSYRRGYHLTDAQRATIDKVLREIAGEPDEH